MPPIFLFFCQRAKKCFDIVKKLELGLAPLCVSTSVQQTFPPLFEILNTPLAEGMDHRETVCKCRRSSRFTDHHKMFNAKKTRKRRKKNGRKV